MYFVARMFVDALQDVDQVRVWIDVAQFARNEQTLNRSDVFGAEFDPAKRMRSTAHT